jgi:hypothetical protein
LSSRDRGDIVALAKRDLIKSAALRRRSEHTVVNYLGNPDSLKGAINIACRIVEDTQRRDSR